MKQIIFSFFSCTAFAETLCKVGDETTPDCEGLDGRLAADDTTDDVRVELLQRDLQLKHSKIKAQGSLTMNPWNCALNGSSFQATTPDDKSEEYSNITRWFRENGTYGTVVQIPFSKTSPKFRSINSCAVHPTTEKLYCSMEINNKGSFLVAIDAEKIGFVHKLLPWMWAATFDHKDNYYAYGAENNQELGLMTVISGVSDMTVYESWSDLDGLGQQTSSAVKVKVNGNPTERFRVGADFALINWDVQGTGENQIYLASMLGDEMKLLLVSSEYELFTLTCEKTCNLPHTAPPNYPKKRVWGSAWSYSDSKKMYFSPDDGSGVHVAHPKRINWKDQTFFANWYGPAVETDWNDGISCPIDEGIAPADICKDSMKMLRSTTENLDKDNAINKIVSHDPDTGKDTGEGWVVSDAGLKGINACAVNPVDNIIYCILHYGNGDWVARLSTKGTIGFVRKVYNYAYAATFDSKGTYWFLNNNEGLMKLDDLSKYEAFDLTNNEDNKNISQQGGEIQYYDGESYSKILGADFAIWKTTEDNVAKTYIVSILRTCLTKNPPQEFKNRISLVDITDGTPKKVLVLDDTGVLPRPLADADTPDFMRPNDVGCQTWGSSWNMIRKGKEGIFFAPDSAQGVYKLEKIDLKSSPPTATFSDTGISVGQVGWNNGFSCKNEQEIQDIGKVSSS